MEVPYLLAAHLALLFVMISPSYQLDKVIKTSSFDQEFNTTGQSGSLNRNGIHTVRFEAGRFSLSDNVIQISVTSAGLPLRDRTTGKCNYMVSFRESYVDSSDPVLTVCGHETPVFVTKGRFIRMTYETIVMPSFWSGVISLKYKNMDKVEEEKVYSFSQTYTMRPASTGQLSYGLEDPNYSARFRRQVRLQTSSISPIQIDVIMSDLPPANSLGVCEDASLKFYDGFSESSSLLATVCGSKEGTQSFSSSTYSVLVVFEAPPYWSRLYDGVMFTYKKKPAASYNTSNAGLIAGICAGSVVFCVVVTFIVYKAIKSRRPGTVITYTNSAGPYVINTSSADPAQQPQQLPVQQQQPQQFQQQAQPQPFAYQQQQPQPQQQPPPPQPQPYHPAPQSFQPSTPAPQPYPHPQQPPVEPVLPPAYHEVAGVGKM